MLRTTYEPNQDREEEKLEPGAMLEREAYFRGSRSMPGSPRRPLRYNSLWTGIYNFKVPLWAGILGGVGLAICFWFSLSLVGRFLSGGDLLVSSHLGVASPPPRTLLPRLESALSSQSPDTDPYLAYRPAFTYSLPVQILIQGITLTLLAVLLIHILFTTQYHFPLSKFNYLLQLSGILLVLGSIMGSLVVVMETQKRASSHWPYMLDYISVITPPSAWSQQQKGAWYFLQSLCNGMVHLTHIQFLTLLFPSATEVKLIFLLLGPLALAASGLTFTSLSSSRNTIDLGDAIRNVFDGTLLLIFSVSLVIWGLLVNRKRAWRFDGGTAAFGAGATILAIVSTAINFVEVKEDTINWLQNLLWAIVLWQSWLGFWWWVGSGMGVGEVEDMVQKEEKKRLRNQRRREARRRRDSLPLSADDRATGVTSALETPRTRPGRTLARDRPVETGDPVSGPDDLHPHDLNDAGNATDRGRALTGSSSSSDASPMPLESVSGIFAYPINLVLRYVRNLRSGHEEATKRKVLRRAKLRQQVFEGHNGATSEGWGLGSFGIREAEDSERRLSEANRIARGEQLIPERSGPSGEEEEGASAESDLESGRGGGLVQHDAQIPPGASEPPATPNLHHETDQAGGVRGVLRKWRLVDRSVF